MAATGKCKVCGNSNIGLTDEGLLKEHIRSVVIGGSRSRQICLGSGQKPKK